MLLLLKVKCKGKLVLVFYWISCHEDVWIDGIVPEPVSPLGRKKNVLPIPGIKPCFLDCPVHILVNVTVNLKCTSLPNFITIFAKQITKLKRKENRLITNHINGGLTSQASWPPSFLILPRVWEMLCSIRPTHWISQLRTFVFPRNPSGKWWISVLK